MDIKLFCFIALTTIAVPINTLYEESCQEELLFKPYMKIYDGRTDPDNPLEWGATLDHEQGPGLYDTEEWTDTYICLNGPVWLYYERKTTHGIVFDFPQFKVFRHECQFFNGVKGPGSTADRETLQALLLMGQEEDYRLPFLQLFTAPLYNNETNMYENVTSLMTLGNAHCTITKGTGSNKRTIVVVSDPNEKHSHCRLSYKNIKKMFPAPVGWTPDPGKTRLSNGNVGQIYEDTLKNDELLKKGSCEDPDKPPSHNSSVYNLTTFEDIETTNYSGIVARWTTTKPGVENPTSHKLHLHILSVIENSIDGTPDPDIKRKAIYEKFVRIRFDEIDYLMTPSPPPANPATTKPFSVPDLIKEIKKVTEHDDVAAAVNKFQTGLNEISAAVAALETCKKTNFASPCRDQATLLEDVETEKDKFIETKKVLEWAAKTLKHLLAELKNLLQTLEISMDEFDVVYKAWKDAVDGGKKEYTGGFDFKATAPFIKMPVNETDPATPDITKCEKLSTVGEVCKANRPDKVRACQLLRAAMGNPQSCATPEKAATTSTVTGQPLSELLDDTVKDVLLLIEEIFTNACPQKHFHGNLAKSMNNMFQCYIVKLPEDNGAGYRKKSPGTPLGPKDVENHKFWVHVKDALKECKDHKRTLKFTEDVTGNGNHKFHALTKAGTYEERPVEHLKEQADKEYSFNFALDMHFKIFVTVMGLCMPSYEMKIPLITTMFYAKYTETFFQPLQKTWTDPKDNAILRVIFGNFHNPQTLFWATQCMEASFVQSGEKNFRPPRHLPVNANIEQNFFTSGPLANSGRRYARSVV